MKLPRRVRQVAEQERVRVLDVVEPVLDVVAQPVLCGPARPDGPGVEHMAEHRGPDDRCRRRMRCTRAGRAPCAAVRCRFAGSVRFAIASVDRSSAIAMITIATPAKIAKTGSVYSPFVTASPRPAPPIRPAITTIESAKRIVWLTESNIMRARQRDLHLRQHLPPGRAERRGRLDRVGHDAADPESGDPDRGRDGVDHRRHHRRARTDREEDHDRDQVRERGDDLHCVEERGDRPVEPRRAAGDHTERHADEERERRRQRTSGRTSATASSQSPSTAKLTNAANVPIAAFTPPKRSTINVPSAAVPGHFRK